jgi:hypothetical protein
LLSGEKLTDEIARTRECVPGSFGICFDSLASDAGIIEVVRSAVIDDDLYIVSGSATARHQVPATFRRASRIALQGWSNGGSAHL